MDRICNAVFEKISSLAPIGRYVIISDDEFFENFPEDGERSETELKRALKALISDNLVDLKYSGGNMYCVSPLKKYEPVEEIAEIPETEELAPVKTVSGNMLAFVAAFAGGAAGSFIVSLVFSLIS